MTMHKKINKKFLRTTTEGYYPHAHLIELDKNGNGRTIETLSGPIHSHVIKKFVVESDGGHTHEVDEDTKELLKVAPKEE